MRSILIIDDNPGVGEALSLLLSLHDMRALVATDPAQGLALLESESELKALRRIACNVCESIT